MENACLFLYPLTEICVISTELVCVCVYMSIIITELSLCFVEYPDCKNYMEQVLSSALVPTRN